MKKKLVGIPLLLILTGWGLNNKPKDLYSYVESARPSQTRTLKALAARLYIEALNATEEILRLANSMCGIKEYEAENTPYLVYAAEHREVKDALQSFINETPKREQNVMELTQSVVATFKKKIAKIEDNFHSQKTLPSKTEAIKKLFEDYRKALVILNISYSTIMDALKRVKATYHENNFALPEHLTFKTLGLDGAIKNSSDSQELQDWLSQSDFYKNSLCHLQQQK